VSLEVHAPVAADLINGDVARSLPRIGQRRSGGFVEHTSLRYRNATDRRESIILALRTQGFVSIADLTRELGVSHMTVRRDLQHLEQTGQVRMVYGGVSLTLPALHDSGRWVNSHAADEARIGRCAATLVGEADAIAIDAGRLGYEVARALPDQFHGTVITHSIPVIQLLMSRPRPPRVVGLGGELMADRAAFVGAGTVAAIAGVRVETLFLAADGIDVRGAYAHSDAEASVKRALLDVAIRPVVVARHDSFADSAPLLLSVLGRLAALVTDRRPPNRLERALRQAGVKVLVAEDREHPAPSDNGRRHPPGSVQAGSVAAETPTPPNATAEEAP
jgi:DeoR family fructose operon transcriptional repressor